jgi:predicted AlkP superfamily phosphohydrolase/phosphomutase
MYRLTMRLRQGRQVAKTFQKNKQGFLTKLRQIFLSFADVDWSKTKAYGLGNYGQLYVNLRGREPLGIVSPGVEYQKVVNDLVDQLNQMQNPKTGEPIPLKIYRREDIYQGSHLDEGPDVVFLPEDMRYNGYGLFQFTSKSWLEACFDRSGGHRMDGLFMIVGPGIRKGSKIENARLIDLCPTILATLDVPIPNDLDGRVLSDAFEDGFFQDHPIRSTQARVEQARPELELSPEQEEMVKQRLRGLGYIA